MEKLIIISGATRPKATSNTAAIIERFVKGYLTQVPMSFQLINANKKEISILHSFQLYKFIILYGKLLLNNKNNVKYIGNSL